MAGKYHLEAVQKRNQTLVKITRADGRGRNSVHYARLDEQGRIVYDKPEKIPDVVKQQLAPAFFKKMKREAMGIV